MKFLKKVEKGKNTLRFWAIGSPANEAAVSAAPSAPGPSPTSKLLLLFSWVNAYRALTSHQAFTDIKCEYDARPALEDSVVARELRQSKA